MELGNITTDTYSKNLNNLLEKIYSDKEIDDGFYNFSDGEEPDKVYAIGLCRGDVKAEACRSCLSRASSLLTDRCRQQKEAIGWYEVCMLRYSNSSIVEQTVTDSSDIVKCSPDNTTKKDAFDEALEGLVDRLRTTAAGGDSRRKIGEGEAPVRSSDETIYGLLQCAPYLSYSNCSKCLQYAMSRTISLSSPNCEGRSGGRYLGRSCSLRYDIYSFFDFTVDAPAPQPTQPLPLEKGVLETITMMFSNFIAVSHNSCSISNLNDFNVLNAQINSVSIYGLGLTHTFVKTHASGDGEADESEGDDESELGNNIKTDELLQYDFATIKFATNNFSDANKLGQGGFGIVYKGTLSDGQEIAIKRLSINSNQGETEFKNEIMLTGKLQHRNLVRLLGFCFARRERLLIYEFVPNKSLDYLIFDPNKRASLNWERRYSIIRGIARGLLYLHEDSRLPVVHRDLKTSNILLDKELNPKISDFGMARLFEINQTQANTSTIVGTFGYMAPEYIKHGQFSIKSDVFSFGVMILEIVCGQRNSEIHSNEENAQDLLSFAWQNWRGGTVSNIVDPTLKDYSWNEIMRCIHIGLLCVQEDIGDRPSMNSVSLMLSSSSFPLATPSEPAFLMRGKRPLPMAMATLLDEQYSEATRSSDSGTQGSSDKAPITDPYPR
uniref:Cysteine-rich receptor-like protein kinase 29 n=1 Tax=Cajanus cajan TaxID=3821 RepID=A0A151U7I6_CAJCA|nr:Cysteine-rich receptor-like protein kinase 29 [Cajanus cajan]